MKGNLVLRSIARYVMNTIFSRRGLQAIRATRALCSGSKPASSVDITQRCADRIKHLTKVRGHDVALRVTVDGGGCSGFQYVFAIEDPSPVNEQQNEDDNIFGKDGAHVIVDNLSLAYIGGAKIDYQEELISSSFRVTDNPNSESSCGCGVSFVAKS